MISTERQELRLRLIEAVTKQPPTAHSVSRAAGILEIVRELEDYVCPPPVVGQVQPPSKLPSKK